MNAEDYKILINKVWFRGFWVPGIANQRSDKKWRPKVEFINNDVVFHCIPIQTVLNTISSSRRQISITAKIPTGRVHCIQG